MFYNGLRALMFSSLLAFIIATPFVTGSELVGWLMLAGMVPIEVPRVIFLFKRPAAKKRRWIELLRFSDDNNGY
jgi:hypothetical protein